MGVSSQALNVVSGRENGQRKFSLPDGDGSKPAERPDAAGQNLYLIGRPKLKDFLHYVGKHAIHPQPENELITEWEAARTLLTTLEKEEAGLADAPTISRLSLNSEYKELLTEFVKDPLVQNSFNSVPTEVGFVELDRLVVYQKHIDITFVRQLQAALGPAPTAEKIFKTCLPFDHPKPPVKWARMQGNRYVFLSASNDLRFLGTMPLEPDNIVNYPPPGSIVGVVGLAVGFGSNFMNAVYTGKRLILINGSHRAYALRDMGITHAPCIIQHTSSLDQLDVIASSDVADDQDFFLNHPRPSMLKDYLNPQLRKVMDVHRRFRQVIVKFEIDEAFVPEF